MLHLSAEEVHTQMRNSVIPHPNSVIPKKLARFVLNRFLGPKKWSSGYGKKKLHQTTVLCHGKFSLDPDDWSNYDIGYLRPSRRLSFAKMRYLKHKRQRLYNYEMCHLAKIVQASWNLSYANWCTTVQNVIKSGRGLFDSLIACFAIFLTTAC